MEKFLYLQSKELLGCNSLALRKIELNDFLNLNENEFERIKHIIENYPQNYSSRKDDSRKLSNALNLLQLSNENLEKA